MGYKVALVKCKGPYLLWHFAEVLPCTSPRCGPGIWCFACGYYYGVDYDQLHLITVCKASELKEGGIRFMNILFVYLVPSHIPPLTRLLPPGKSKTNRSLAMPSCDGLSQPATAQCFFVLLVYPFTFDTCIQCTFVSPVYIYLLLLTLPCIFCLYYVTSF